MKDSHHCLAEVLWTVARLRIPHPCVCVCLSVYLVRNRTQHLLDRSRSMDPINSVLLDIVWPKNYMLCQTLPTASLFIYYSFLISISQRHMEILIYPTLRNEFFLHAIMSDSMRTMPSLRWRLGTAHFWARSYCFKHFSLHCDNHILIQQKLRALLMKNKN